MTVSYGYENDETILDQEDEELLREILEDEETMREILDRIRIMMHRQDDEGFEREEEGEETEEEGEQTDEGK